MYDGLDVLAFTKLKRLQWAGHVIRACVSRAIKKIFNAKPEAKRKVGRQKLRWRDEVNQDISTFGIKTRGIEKNGEIF